MKINLKNGHLQIQQVESKRKSGLMVAHQRFDIFRVLDGPDEYKGGLYFAETGHIQTVDGSSFIHSDLLLGGVGDETEIL